MLNYLDNLRKKPIGYRRRVLVFVTSAMTGLVLLVWISTLNFGGMGEVVDAAAAAKELRPIDEVKTSVVNLYALTVEAFKAVGASLGSGAATDTPSQQ